MHVAAHDPCYRPNPKPGTNARSAGTRLVEPVSVSVAWAPLAPTSVAVAGALHARLGPAEIATFVAVATELMPAPAPSVAGVVPLPARGSRPRTRPSSRAGSGGNLTAPAVPQTPLSLVVPAVRIELLDAAATEALRVSIDHVQLSKTGDHGTVVTVRHAAASVRLSVHTRIHQQTPRR